MKLLLTDMLTFLRSADLSAGEFMLLSLTRDFGLAKSIAEDLGLTESVAIAPENLLLHHGTLERFMPRHGASPDTASGGFLLCDSSA